MKLADYFNNSTGELNYNEMEKTYAKYARRALERDDLKEYYSDTDDDEIISSLAIFDFAVQDHVEQADSDDEGGDDGV